MSAGVLLSREASIAPADRELIVRHIQGCVSDGILDPKQALSYLGPAFGFTVPQAVFQEVWVSLGHPWEEEPSSKYLQITMAPPASSSPDVSPEASTPRPATRRRGRRTRVEEKPVEVEPSPHARIHFQGPSCEFRAEQTQEGTWSVLLQGAQLSAERVVQLSELFQRDVFSRSLPREPPS